MNAANPAPVHDAPTVEPQGAPSRITPTPPQYTAADRFMRKLLRVEGKQVDRSARTEREAHRSFRTSMIVSGVRCLITYLLIPILVPIIGFAGVLAAPIGIALCCVAYVTGVYSLRKFWVSNHRSRWMYTAFIAVVFVILAIAIAADISRMVHGA